MMAAKTMKAAFTTGIHYLNHQQYIGGNLGGMQMINRRLEFSKSLHNKDLYAHYGCVNAVEFSNDGEWLVSGGDDKRVLIWNVDRTLSGSYQPKVMKGEHNSNIFCLGFNASHTKLYSAGNDEQVILHDVRTAEILDVFLHDEAVYGLSVDPINENIFVSACDDGRVLIWDIRQTYNDAYTLASCSSAYHAVMHNPVEPQYIATANAKDGVCLWDVRKPRVSVVKYGSSNASQSAMSVRFNSTGTHILALRRRLPPVLYDVTSGHTSAEFDHPEYYNSCTMKSCCFAGERDQYVLSGSDDFKLYVWKVPDNLTSKRRIWVGNAHFVLRGHRSIVNQVRYNNAYGILASSGVEKIVKIWSSFPMSYNEATEGYVSERDLSRKVYSHEEYINLVLESGQFMTHDYSHHSVQEDPRMMAFFDSLVQRDIEGWTSDSSDATEFFASFEVQTSESSHSSSSAGSSSDTDDEQPSAEDVARSNSILYAYQNILYDCRKLQFPISISVSADSNVNNKTTTEEKKDFSIDRISHLIAQKRQETRRRSARTVLSRHYKTMRKTMKHKKGSHENDADSSSIVLPSQSDSHSILDDESKAVLADLVAKMKDKRKLLCRKRAKINKAVVLVDSSSSDSDDCHTENPVSNSNTAGDEQKVSENDCSANRENHSEEETSDVNSSINHKDTIKIDTVVPNASNGLNGNVTKENDTDSSLPNSSISLNGSSTKDSNSVDSVLPNSSNSLNGNATKDNNDIDSILPNSSNGLNGNATNPNSLVYFSTKNGKHNNRNYRKRSAEEMEDD